MTLVQLLGAGLAVWQAVEIWRHSLLFAGLRARAELLEGRLGELLGCPWCLSVWAAWLLVLPPFLLPLPSALSVLDMPGASFAAWCAFRAWELFVYGLAVSRLANLLNDALHGVCRTPRADRPDLKDVFLIEGEDHDGRAEGRRPEGDL